MGKKSTKTGFRLSGKWIGLLVVLLTLCRPAMAQKVQDLSYQFIGFNSKDTVLFPDKNDRQLVDDFWSEIRYLDQMEQTQTRFNGKASFGFSGDQSNNQDLFKIDGGISVTRGIYPNEFFFTTSIGMVLNNRKFNENVSNIFISYDYHPAAGNGLLFQHFVFLSRFTDAFLDIDQRYEIGGGTVLAWWSKKLSAKGERETAKLDKLKFDPDSTDKRSGQWRRCLDNFSQKYGVDGVKPADVKRLQSAQRLARLSLRKLFSTARLGLLGGLFLETEKADAADSLLGVNGKKYFTQSFEPTQKIRWELRPTIDFQPTDAWSFKLRPYFKFPMPWVWNETVTRDVFSDKRADIRIDLESALSIRLKEMEETINRNVSIELNYKIYYDNAPQRAFLDELDANNRPLLLKANSIHQMFRLSFRVDF